MVKTYVRVGVQISNFSRIHLKKLIVLINKLLDKKTTLNIHLIILVGRLQQE